MIEGWRAFAIGLGLTVLLLVTSASGQEVIRGIYFEPGEKLKTALEPASDVDDFTFFGVMGAEISFTLKASSGSLRPEMVLLDGDLETISTSSHTKVSARTVKLRKFPLPYTGQYTVRVSDPLGRTGPYTLKTKGKMGEVPGYPEATLGPGETREYRFGAGPGMEVRITVKPTPGRNQVAVTSLTDPDGEEVPHGAASFFRSRKRLSSVVTLRSSARSSWREGSDPRRLGEYLLRVGMADPGTTCKVKIRVDHPEGSGTRVISPLIPTVAAVDPTFGVAGDEILITGSDFQPGPVIVLMGEHRARGVERLSATEIRATVPAREAPDLVDLTVINPDGQEGSLVDAYLYTPDPPIAISVDQAVHPDSGGTLVNVYGSRLQFVERITIGADELAGAPEVVTSSHVRFTTEAHAAGTYSLTLSDRAGQSDTLTDALMFVGPPSIASVSPDQGTFSGGMALDILGQNFAPGGEVRWDGAPVSDVQFVSTTVLRIVSPAGTRDHEVTLQVRDQWGRSGSLTGAFTYGDRCFVDVSTETMPDNTSGRILGGTAIALGDIDGDGDLDVIVGRETAADGRAQTHAFSNDGTGGFAVFQTPKGSASGDDGQASAVILGDLDGDGDLDLVVSAESIFNDGAYSYSYVYPTSWNPGWGSYRYYHYKRFSYDIPYASTRVLLNDGQGGFSHASTAMPDPAVAGGDLWQGNALALGDIDDDGDLDIILSRGETIDETTTSTYRYLGSTYTVNWYLWTYRYHFRSYSYRWFDSEESGDRSATRVLLNDGDARFTDATVAMLPVGGSDLLAADAIALADVDGDGDPDLVITGDGDALRDPFSPANVTGAKTRVLLNDGDGSFTHAGASFFPAPVDGDDRGGAALGLGDLDGDGDLDLVLTTPVTLYATASQSHRPSTRVFLKGSSGFVEASSALPGVRADGQGDLWRGTALGLARVDGGSSLDLVLTDASALFAQDPGTGLFTVPTSSTRVLTNDGTASFTDETEGLLPVAISQAVLGQAVALGDVDDDGDRDLLLTSDLAGDRDVGERPTRLYEFR